MFSRSIFFNWKLSAQSFAFWAWTEEFWICFIWKLEEKAKIYIVLESFLFLSPLNNIETGLKIYEPIQPYMVMCVTFRKKIRSIDFSLGEQAVE